MITDEAKDGAGTQAGEAFGLPVEPETQLERVLLDRRSQAVSARQLVERARA